MIKGSAKVKPNNNDDVPEMLPLTDKSISSDQLTVDGPAGKARTLLRGMWQEVWEKGNNPNFLIISGSMSPMIEVNDVVIVSRVEASRIGTGDVVAFYSGQIVTVHRIIGKRRPGGRLHFREMGDACRHSGRFPAENLIGKVITIQKKGREIHLDSYSQTLKNRMAGFRLLLFDLYNRKLRRRLRHGPWRAILPTWRFSRSDSPGTGKR